MERVRRNELRRRLDRTYEELKRGIKDMFGKAKEGLDRTYEELKLALTDNVARLGILAFRSYL